jgi:hypothetical protein
VAADAVRLASTSVIRQLVHDEVRANTWGRKDIEMDGQLQRGQEEPEGLARRTFLKRAAIGVGALSAVALIPLAQGDEESETTTAMSVDEIAAAGPVLVYVRHAERGEAVLMADGTERVVTDRALVSHVLRAQHDHLS